MILLRNDSSHFFKDFKKLFLLDILGHIPDKNGDVFLTLATVLSIAGLNHPYLMCRPVNFIYNF